jgi:hypothetical protein
LTTGARRNALRSLLSVPCGRNRERIEDPDGNRITFIGNFRDVY